MSRLLDWVKGKVRCWKRCGRDGWDVIRSEVLKDIEVHVFGLRLRGKLLELRIRCRCCGTVFRKPGVVLDAQSGGAVE